MPAVLPIRQLRCQRCGAEFTCGADASDTGARCWCQELPPVSARLAESDCLCGDCLRDEIRREQAAAEPAPFPNARR